MLFLRPLLSKIRSRGKYDWLEMFVLGLWLCYSSIFSSRKLIPDRPSRQKVYLCGKVVMTWVYDLASHFTWDSYLHLIYITFTLEKFFILNLCEEIECMIRVWMLSSLWFYVFTLVKKFLKLSMRNVRDANTVTLELFFLVNDTVAPVSSKVKHLHMNLTLFFSIVY